MRAPTGAWILVPGDKTDLCAKSTEATGDRCDVGQHSGLQHSRWSGPQLESAKCSIDADARDAGADRRLDNSGLGGVGMTHPAANTRSADQRKGGQPRPSRVASDCIDWLRDYAERRINSRLIDERRS